MKLKQLCFVILCLIVVSHAIEITCIYERTGWDSIIGPSLTCKVENLNITKTKELITKVTSRRHPASDDSNDKVVNTLLVYEQHCEYFPHGIEKHFDSLNGIAIQKSRLKKITKEDLKVFPELRSISLFGNNLKVLENNLFRYNPKLELVSVFDNQIEYIFSNIFEGLLNLRMVYLNSNVCINEDALDQTKIEQLKCQFVKKCAVTDVMKEFAELETKSLLIDSENARLKENLNAISKNLAQTKQKFDRCRVGYNLFKTKLEEVEEEDEVCVTCSFDLKNCEAEKLELKDLIQDLEIVEIKCENYNQSKPHNITHCKAENLKILKSSMEVISVKNLNKNLDTTKLIIANQQTLFLPLNLTNFFPKIKTLQVTNSELIEVNENVFFGLNELTEVNLSHNKITEVNGFGSLARLSKLDLSHNRIDTLSNYAFEMLPNLEDLRLNDNFLIKITGKVFSSNRKLKILTLHNNKLAQIASNFIQSCSGNLKTLDLSTNECIDSKYPETVLEDILDDIDVNCLVEIELECRFKVDTDYTCHAENLEVENRNAKIVAISGEHLNNRADSDVKTLDVFNQTLKFFPQQLSQFLPNLKKITVESSSLLEISSEAFEGYETLKELKIKKNKLTEVNDEAIENLIFLEVLDFSHNLLNNLSENAFENFTSLKYLDLSHNQLTNLETTLIPVKNSIEKFSVANNCLSSIDPQIIKLLLSADLIDFSKNNCIDSKFDHAVNDDKKIMEIFGEISFKCINGN